MEKINAMSNGEWSSAWEVFAQYSIAGQEKTFVDRMAARARDTSRQFVAYHAAHDICAAIERETRTDNKGNILSEAQARAIAGAMAELNNVGGTFTTFILTGENTAVTFSFRDAVGCTVKSLHGIREVQTERYADQAAFTDAYGV